MYKLIQAHSSFVGMVIVRVVVSLLRRVRWQWQSRSRFADSGIQLGMAEGAVAPAFVLLISFWYAGWQRM